MSPLSRVSLSCGVVSPLSRGVASPLSRVLLSCSYAVDVWSAGCTFVGMLYHRTHFFMGDSNREQVLFCRSVVAMMMFFFTFLFVLFKIVVITEVMGTEALDNYISKYQVPIDKKWYLIKYIYVFVNLYFFFPKRYAKNIGQWRKKSWASMFTASTMKFYNADLEDLLDHMMVTFKRKQFFFEYFKCQFFKKGNGSGRKMVGSRDFRS